MQFTTLYIQTYHAYATHAFSLFVWVDNSHCKQAGQAAHPLVPESMQQGLTIHSTQTACRIYPYVQD